MPSTKKLNHRPVAKLKTNKRSTSHSHYSIIAYFYTHSSHLSVNAFGFVFVHPFDLCMACSILMAFCTVCVSCMWLFVCTSIATEQLQQYFVQCLLLLMKFNRCRVVGCNSQCVRMRKPKKVQTEHFCAKQKRKAAATTLIVNTPRGVYTINEVSQKS